MNTLESTVAADLMVTGSWTDCFTYSRNSSGQIVATQHAEEDGSVVAQFIVSVSLEKI